MHDAITDVPGILVGHAQDLEGGTGCTVVLCGNGALAAVDVRGGAPGTRETDGLDPANSLSAVQAVLLSGGSAFGLDAASGVVAWLEERGLGFETGFAKVPIVPAAVIYDLSVGNPRRRPDAAMGRAACEAAASGPVAQGNVGAGTGATIGPKAMLNRIMKGGLGTASRRVGGLVVGAIVVVNGYGDVVDPATGETLAGVLREAGDGFAGAVEMMVHRPVVAKGFSTNTTIATVATNARLTKAQARRVAMMAHDGFARAIAPVHTGDDGDTIFVLATGEVDADGSAVGAAAAEVVARAIVSAVKHAESAYGLPGYREIRELIKRRA
ncbi:MAG: P1 family peptidase [Spirochaetes bacterium]|nr:P1 family peptidase [Spirochaetota bacterium]